MRRERQVPTRPKREFLDLSPADIAGRYYVEAQITPDVEGQERMMRAQLAQAFRAPGTDGRPMLADRDVLERVLEMPDPDTLARHIDDQLLPASDQEVARLLGLARLSAWMERNPEIVALARKQMDAAPVMGDKQEAAGKMMDEMQAQPGGLDALAQAVGLPPQGQPMGQPMGQPHPAAMPSQMMMTPEEALPNPATLPASQARRGKPRNKR